MWHAFSEKGTRILWFMTNRDLMLYLISNILHMLVETTDISNIHTVSNLKKSDLVKLPRCLLDYGWIGSDPRGREVEILDIFLTCEKVMGAVQSA